MEPVSVTSVYAIRECGGEYSIWFVSGNQSPESDGWKPPSTTRMYKRGEKNNIEYSWVAWERIMYQLPMTPFYARDY